MACFGAVLSWFMVSISTAALRSFDDPVVTSLSALIFLSAVVGFVWALRSGPTRRWVLGLGAATVFISTMLLDRTPHLRSAYLTWRCADAAPGACERLRDESTLEDRAFAVALLCERRPNVMDCESALLNGPHPQACTCMSAACDEQVGGGHTCVARSPGWRERACQLTRKHCSPR